MSCDDTVRIKVVRGDILIKHTLGQFLLDKVVFFFPDNHSVCSQV